ncbi:MAG: class I SAM-dependent methyltransferase [Patescibacteria group bacterium]|nr:class I SAM-dependent methyltransferase [Patescibacteria group bacterium]
MDTKKLLDKFYKQSLPDKVLWDKEPPIFLEKVLDSGQVPIGKALDLGTGTGSKAIQLAKRGFDVTAVDISETAISYAKEQAQKEKVEINFIVADVTDLSILGNQKFDLILDWACLHHIQQAKQKKYISGVKNFCKSGDYLILRCFSKYKMSPGEIGFLTPFGPIYLFSLEDITALYGDAFEIIESSRCRRHVHSYRWFEEVLMRRK